MEYNEFIEKLRKANNYLEGFPDGGDCANAKLLCKEARKGYRDNISQLLPLLPELNKLEEEVGMNQTRSRK